MISKNVSAIGIGADDGVKSGLNGMMGKGDDCE
jgi:glycerol-3-phosphate dehydrogenase